MLVRATSETRELKSTVQMVHENGGATPDVPPSLDGELDVLARATNYRDWLFAMTAPHLGDRIVEVGSGLGTMTHCIEERARVVALELLPHYIAALDERFQDRRNVEVVEGDATDSAVWARVREGGLLDSAMSFNVVEHIEDDVAVMKNVHDTLRPGGRMVIFTPAFPRLYGPVDAAVGHVRRYRRRELAAKARVAGFRVIDCHYVNAPGFFLWYLNGRVLKSAGVSADSKWTVRVFDKIIVPVVRLLESHWHPPFGQSLLLIAEKPTPRS